MGQITDAQLAKRFICADKQLDRPCCLGLIASIRQALNDEHDAVNTYLEISESYSHIGKTNVANLINHIASEEREHEIELEQLLEALEKECNLSNQDLNLLMPDVIKVRKEADEKIQKPWAGI